jgi:hypothetical protein
MAVLNKYETREELLETTFSVQSVQRLYKVGELPLENSLETAVGGVGG